MVKKGPFSAHGFSLRGNDRVANFLVELTQLTDKYDIRIEACGCCNGPWLVDFQDDKRIIHEGLEYEKGGYSCYDS